MKTFEFPEIELLELDVSDILATSNPFEEENNELVGWNWN